MAAGALAHCHIAGIFAVEPVGTSMSSTSPTRLDFQEKVIAEFIALTPGETEAHRLFSDLAYATNHELAKLGLYQTCFVFSPDSASFGLAHVRAVGANVSDELLQGWKRFAELYSELIARNPRLELRDLMQDISERWEAASWPYMWEWDIERWISDGAPDTRMPYSVDDDIRDRLLELYPILGGWLYLNETNMVMFADTAAFRQIKKRLDAERNERIRLEKAESDAAKERHEATMHDSVAVKFGGITLYMKDKEAAVELQRRLDGAPGHKPP